MQDLSGQVRKTEAHSFAHGGLADIWKGELKKPSGDFEEVAVKVVRASWRDPGYIERLKHKLVREGQVWNELEHPNVTPFYGISFDTDRPGFPCLICPFYPNGDLSKYIQNHPDVSKMDMIVQIAAGLEYLHSLPHAVIHGDIKASNILVNDQQQATLTDFGLSRMLETSGFTTKTVGGTCRWMAYELLAPCEDDDDDEEFTPPLTTESDVWAFGMTVLEILTGQIPFSHIKNDATVILNVMKKILPSKPGNIEPGIWRLLEHCWDFKPEQRPSMNTITAVLNVIRSKPLLPEEIDEFLSALHSKLGAMDTQVANMQDNIRPMEGNRSSTDGKSSRTLWGRVSATFSRHPSAAFKQQRTSEKRNTLTSKQEVEKRLLLEAT
ncbi:kinase-like domain-containing protein [Crucibulum laeve]|uniref:Kinase-like domain-containing protein n=1 Tax=Crucibulum laeve TaxID=68775 RepID=A0A5C3MJT5_9AGAR|nr:kinase-like domain-containing protein [Crucibulum laeve]